jgi:hypothetical protein
MTSLVFGRCNSYAVFFSKWMSGPVGGILVSITASYFGMKVEMAKTLGLCVFMIMWWLNAPVRMGITGLLPIVFLPLLGVCSGVIVSKEYFSDSVVICWGTLLIATAVEKYKLHNRFATRLLNITERYGDPIWFRFHHWLSIHVVVQHGDCRDDGSHVERSVHQTEG